MTTNDIPVLDSAAQERWVSEFEALLEGRQQKVVALDLADALGLSKSTCLSDVSRLAKGEPATVRRWFGAPDKLAAVADALGVTTDVIWLKLRAAVSGTSAPDSDTWRRSSLATSQTIEVPAHVLGYEQRRSTVDDLAQSLRPDGHTWPQRQPPAGEATWCWVEGPEGSGRRTLARQLAAALRQTFGPDAYPVVEQEPPDGWEWARSSDASGRIAVVAARPAAARSWDRVVRPSPWQVDDVLHIVRALAQDEELRSQQRTHLERLARRLEEEPSFASLPAWPATVIAWLGEVAESGPPDTPAAVRRGMTSAVWAKARRRTRGSALEVFDEAILERFWAARWRSASGPGWTRMSYEAALTCIGEAVRSRPLPDLGQSRALELVDGLKGAKPKEQEKLRDELRSWIASRPAEHLLRLLVDAGLLNELDTGDVVAPDERLALLWACRGIAASDCLSFADRWDALAEAGWDDLTLELAIAGIPFTTFVRALAEAPAWAAWDRARGEAIFASACRDGRLDEKGQHELVGAWAGAVWGTLHGLLRGPLRAMRDNNAELLPTYWRHLSTTSRRWRDLLPILTEGEPLERLASVVPETVRGLQEGWEKVDRQFRVHPNDVDPFSGWPLRWLVRLAPAQCPPLRADVLFRGWWSHDDRSPREPWDRLDELARAGHEGATSILAGDANGSRGDGEDEGACPSWNVVPVDLRLRWVGRLNRGTDSASCLRRAVQGQLLGFDKLPGDAVLERHELVSLTVQALGRLDASCVEDLLHQEIELGGEHGFWNEVAERAEARVVLRRIAGRVDDFLPQVDYRGGAAHAVLICYDDGTSYPSSRDWRDEEKDVWSFVLVHDDRAGRAAEALFRLGDPTPLRERWRTGGFGEPPAHLRDAWQWTRRLREACYASLQTLQEQPAPEDAFRAHIDAVTSTDPSADGFAMPGLRQLRAAWRAALGSELPLEHPELRAALDERTPSFARGEPGEPAWHAPSWYVPRVLQSALDSEEPLTPDVARSVMALVTLYLFSMVPAPQELMDWVDSLSADAAREDWEPLVLSDRRRQNRERARDVLLDGGDMTPVEDWLAWRDRGQPGDPEEPRARLLPAVEGAVRADARLLDLAWQRAPESQRDHLLWLATDLRKARDGQPLPPLSDWVFQAVLERQQENLRRFVGRNAGDRRVAGLARQLHQEARTRRDRAYYACLLHRLEPWCSEVVAELEFWLGEDPDPFAGDSSFWFVDGSWTGGVGVLLGVALERARVTPGAEWLREGACRLWHTALDAFPVRRTPPPFAAPRRWEDLRRVESDEANLGRDGESSLYRGLAVLLFELGEGPLVRDALLGPLSDAVRANAESHYEARAAYDVWERRASTEELRAYVKASGPWSDALASELAFRAGARAEPDADVGAFWERRLRETRDEPATRDWQAYLEYLLQADAPRAAAVVGELLDRRPEYRPAIAGALLFQLEYYGDAPLAAGAPHVRALLRRALIPPPATDV